jgi:hypothetical protein
MLCPMGIARGEISASQPTVCVGEHGPGSPLNTSAAGPAGVALIAGRATPLGPSSLVRRSSSGSREDASSMARPAGAMADGSASLSIGGRQPPAASHAR